MEGSSLVSGLESEGRGGELAGTCSSSAFPIDLMMPNNQTKRARLGEATWPQGAQRKSSRPIPHTLERDVLDSQKSVPFPQHTLNQGPRKPWSGEKYREI